MLVVALSLSMAVGCVTAVASGPLKLRKVAKGAVSGIMEARREIIKDKASWEKLWAQHCSLMRPARELPDVDFSREMVIVVTMGTRRTGGYAIEIVSAEEADGALRIRVRRTEPPRGAMTIQLITAPFHMVALPRSDLRPEFIEVDTAAPK
jgi:hypothetical protein